MCSGRRYQGTVQRNLGHYIILHGAAKELTENALFEMRLIDGGDAIILTGGRLGRRSEGARRIRQRVSVRVFISVFPNELPTIRPREPKAKVATNLNFWQKFLHRRRKFTDESLG